ncbi:Transcription factor [Metarhizium rileyi]|uniref:Transcription factor n=1 Tax=Metarhizium rileyi (strain RCEF 4871) TaxID=1649241 RepID=A0A167FJY3_METRR|nr:Transcription factor [Metarhizium rileyi RCEF 4871]
MQRLASIASQGHNITLGAVTSVPDMIPLRMSQGINPSHGRNSILWPLKEPMPGFSGTWTRVTSDANLIQHLLALYFCWEYPTFASLSKEHYLRDFHDGRKRYCTPLLTNALLALGCRFSNNPEARGDPSNPESSGEHFFTECQRLYYRERDHHTLTTIQAMGVMSIREASCGRIATSEYYAGQCMQLAIEMGLHNTPGPDGQTDEDQAECDVRLATFWGAFTLDNALSSAGSVPRTSHMPSLPPRLPMVEEIERHPWMPYTDDGVPLQLPCVQASNERSVFNCFCELSELVHQSLYLVHNPSRPLAAASLLEVYTKFLLWYDQLPEALRLGQNFTPYVLFVHMYYHFATLLLFWPMSGLRILDAEISPRLVCVQAANAIRTLLESYSKLYTLQRTPSLVPYFVLTAAMVHLAVLTDGGQANYPASRRDEPEFAETTDALEQDIAMLTEMKHCHPFASKALSILSYLTDKWAVNVEIEAGPIPLQDCIEICWPYSRCLQCNPPRGLGSEDASSGFGGNSSQQGALRMTKATIESIQHPLLLPILELRQEMPPTTKVLRQAGFSPLT